MNFFSHPFAKRRSIQPEKQAILDTELEKLPCHQTVVEYLLNMREINRRQYKSVESANIFKKYNEIQENIKEIDDQQKTLIDILNEKDICQSLMSRNLCYEYERHE